MVRLARLRGAVVVEYLTVGAEPGRTLAPRALNADGPPCPRFGQCFNCFEFDLISEGGVLRSVGGREFLVEGISVEARTSDLSGPSVRFITLGVVSGLAEKYRTFFELGGVATGTH